MKAKERHELATNELADAMSRWSRGARPYVAYVLIAAVVAVGAIVLHQRRKGESQAYRAETMRAFAAALYTGSDEFDSDTMKARDKKVGAMESFLEAYPDVSLGPLAESCLAGELYNRAICARVTGRGQTEIDADLARAKALYEKLAKRNDEMGRWAQYALACITVQQVSREEGEKQLVALAKQYPESAIEQLANQQLETLRSARPLEFAPPEPATPPADEDDQAKPEAPGAGATEGDGATGD